MKTLVMTIDDIAEVVGHTGINRLMDEMIRRLEQGLMNYDAGTTVIPARAGFEYQRPDMGLLEWMPILEKGHRATFKIVGYHPTNPGKRSLPTIISSLSSFDTATGHLTALADATFLTALRTGAASAVASRIATRPDAGVMGIIGCGAQAVTQLHALSRVFEFKKVLVYDIDPAACRSFSARTAFIGLDVDITPLTELVAQSDIISTATSVRKGEGPVFHDDNVQPWLHINAVGSDFKGKTEIPIGLLKRCFVFPDFLEQAIVEGECQQLEPDDIGPNLSRIVQDRKTYQNLRNTLTVFDSTGWALEDQIAMDLITEHAKELGLGTMVQIEGCSGDPKNPYAFLRLTSEAPAIPRGGEEHIGRLLAKAVSS